MNHQKHRHTMDVARYRPSEWFKRILEMGFRRFQGLIGNAWNLERDDSSKRDGKKDDSKMDTTNGSNSYMRTKMKTQKSTTASSSATQSSFQTMPKTTKAKASGAVQTYSTEKVAVRTKIRLSRKESKTLL